MSRNSAELTATTDLKAQVSDLIGFRRELVGVLGPVLGGAQLAAALGYRTADAFGKAARTNRLPIPTFSIAGRRGRYAMTIDLANWLWAVRNASHQNDQT